VNAFSSMNLNPEGLMEHSGGRGLPEKLPAGERVLWQGSPNWASLLRNAFHARGVAVYFAVIVAVCTAISIRNGLSPEALLISTLKLTGLSIVPIALMALYCWGVQQSTIYSITNRRVVLSFGLAVPMTVNLPFSRIESAGLKHHSDGSGDIPVQLLPSERMAYLMVWPHARPWRMARGEPMLRGLTDANAAAAVLARALAAHAAIPISFQQAMSPGQAAAHHRFETPQAA